MWLAWFCLQLPKGPSVWGEEKEMGLPTVGDDSRNPDDEMVKCVWTRQEKRE